MIPRQNLKFIKDAIFLSHTSLNDFLNCQRAYYLKNIYRDPKSGLRIQVASPYLSLGSTVHDTIHWFLDLKGQVSKDQLLKKFENFWLKFTGKRGGFSSSEDEEIFKKRGINMVINFYDHADSLGKSTPLPSFPKYVLFEDVILNGNFDFLGELPDGSIHVIDFKSGSRDEDSPLQLYIYAILAESNLGKPVTRLSFWYLDRDSAPKEVIVDSLEKTLEWLTEKAKELKVAIKENKWVCKGNSEPGGLCRECQIYEDILAGKGEFEFSDFKFKKDIYFLPR